MPRRRSGLQPLHIAGAVIFLLVAGGAVWFFNRTKVEKMTGNPLSGEQYADNKLVRGNTYLLTGTIQRELKYGNDNSRLFAVETKDDSVPLGVVVPPEFNSMDIQKGQEYQMLVLVGKDGVLRAREIKKS